MSRQVHYGPFWATGRFGNVATPGSCEVVWFGDDARGRKLPRKVIAGVAEDGFPSSVPMVPPCDLIGVWVTLKDSPTFAASLKEARRVADFHGVPVVLYVDEPVLTKERKRQLKRGLFRKDRDVLALQCYPLTIGFDTIEAATARFRANFAMVGDDWSLAIVRPLYDRSGQWPMPLVLGLQDPITEIGLTDSRVRFDLWFAWLRPSGVVTHPELAAVAQKIADQYATLEAT